MPCRRSCHSKNIITVQNNAHPICDTIFGLRLCIFFSMIDFFALQANVLNAVSAVIFVSSVTEKLLTDMVN